MADRNDQEGATGAVTAQSFARSEAPAPAPGPLAALASLTDPGGVPGLVRCDPCLGGRILSLLGPEAAPASIDRAVELAGPSLAREAVLAQGLAGHLGVEAEAPILPAFAQRCVEKAIAARRLAERLGDPHPEIAYAVGLVQEIGWLVMFRADPDFFLERSQRDQTAGVTTERQRFGVDHAAVGAALLRGWSAPGWLTQAVRDHHERPGGDSIFDRAVYFAGLLPHWNESLSEAERDDFTFWYEKGFAEDHDGEAALLHRLAHDATEEVRAAGAAFEGPDPPLKTLGREVGEQAIQRIVRIRELEHAVDERRRRNAEVVQELRGEAFKDELTNLLNRRGFFALANHRLQQAIEQQTGVCCVMLDLDDFKGINDTYGHANGDRVLRGVAKLMRRSFRQGDLLARLGGDEFVVLVTGINEEEARSLGHSIVERVQQNRIRVESDLNLRIRVSAGVTHAELATPDTSLDQLLRVADEALYDRKAAGKGAVGFLPNRSAQPPRGSSDPRPAG